MASPILIKQQNISYENRIGNSFLPPPGASPPTKNKFLQNIVSKKVDFKKSLKDYYNSALKNYI